MSEKIPWWARNELAATLIAASLLALVSAYLGKASVAEAVSTISITLVALLIIRFEPLVYFFLRKILGVAWLTSVLVIKSIINFLWSPFTALLAVILLMMLSEQTFYKVLALWILYFAIGRDSVQQRLEKVSIFRDNFVNGLVAWCTKAGSPRIDTAFGKDAPSLSLPFVGEDPTHSFAYVNEPSNIADGEIECDVYLTGRSAVNVVFRADVENARYYVARLGTCPEYSDSLLRRDGLDSSWHPIGRSLCSSSTPGWHKLRVGFTGNYLALYKDGERVAYALDRAFKSGRVGVFNEHGQVYIDNFKVATLRFSIRDLLYWLFGFG